MLKDQKNEHQRIVIAPLEVWDTSKRVMGVYKMSFDERYYIGSTTSIRERFLKHLNALRSGRSTRLLREAFSECSKITIEILHINQDNQALRELERQEILANISNGKCLNQTMHVRILVGIDRSWKPVRAYGNNGEEINFLSGSAAAIHAGIEGSNFRYKLRYGIRTKGYVYKILDESGTPIEPQRLPEKVKKRYIGKALAKYDLQGSLLEIFPSIQLAAESVGSHGRHLSKYLKGKGRTYKKYIWKYV